VLADTETVLRAIVEKHGHGVPAIANYPIVQKWAQDAEQAVHCSPPLISKSEATPLLSEEERKAAEEKAVSEASEDLREQLAGKGVRELCLE